jgi:hypothetical protein
MISRAMFASFGRTEVQNFRISELLTFLFFPFFYHYCVEHSQSPKAKEKQYNERGNNKQDWNFGSSELLTVSSSEGGGTLACFELFKVVATEDTAPSRAPCMFCNCGDLRKEG